MSTLQGMFTAVLNMSITASYAAVGVILVCMLLKKSGLWRANPLAFGESHVETRTKNILNYKKPAFWLIIAVFLTVAVAVLAFAANPQKPFDLERTKAQAMRFSTDETDLLKIGEAAFNHYYTSYLGNDIPEPYRITEFKLNAISLVAGDEKEFCVWTVSDYSTPGLHFLSANGNFEPTDSGYRCEGDGKEFRIKGLGNNAYQIVSIGTGGGAQGLQENASRYKGLEPTAAAWRPEQSVGADMAVLDYASDDIVIFHGYFGLYVYDLNKLQIVRSLDLAPIKCNATQGDNYCEVAVSMDGNAVQLHPLNSKNMYLYDVADNKLYETGYKPLQKPFGRLVPLEEAVATETGNYSYNAVKFATGEYGLLHVYDWTLGTLSYSRADMMYALFQVKE
ncbi:hypothetical protein [Syntrophomonas curvata]